MNKQKKYLQRLKHQKAKMLAKVKNEPYVDEFEATVGDLSLATKEVPAREYIFHTDDGFGVKEGFLPAGETCIFAAPGGCGKTYLSMQAAISAACGGTWLHARALKPVGVLYLAAEESADELTRRFQNIIRITGLNDDPQRMALINKNLRLHSRLGKHERLITDDGKKAELFGQLDFFLSKHQDVKLMILDPASKYMGAEVETNSAKAQDWVNLLSRFTLGPAGVSVLVIHHIRKEGGKTKAIFKVDEKDQVPNLSMDDIRGSSGIANGFRWALMLIRRRYEDQSEKVFLRVAKTNYSKQGGTLEFSPDENHSGILKFKKVFSEYDVENSDSTNNEDSKNTQTKHDYSTAADDDFIAKELF